MRGHHKTAVSRLHMTRLTATINHAVNVIENVLWRADRIGYEVDPACQLPGLNFSAQGMKRFKYPLEIRNNVRTFQQFVSFGISRVFWHHILSQDTKIGQYVADTCPAKIKRINVDSAPPPNSVPTAISPAAAAEAIAVRASPRLSMITIADAPNALPAATVLRFKSGSFTGSITELGMISSDDPPECKSRNTSARGNKT